MTSWRLDRRDRPAQAPRCLLMRADFKIAEHRRSTVFLWQPVHFTIMSRGARVVLNDDHILSVPHPSSRQILRHMRPTLGEATLMTLGSWFPRSLR